MAPVTIRVAAARDAAPVAGLLVAQLRGLGLDADEAATRELVDMLAERPRRARFVVAECDGRLIGVAALVFSTPIEFGAPAVWLEELYIEPAWRGQSIGTRLLAAAERVAADAGAVAVDLEVDDHHPRAQSLYERAGYTPLPRRHWVKRLIPARTTPPLPTHMTGGCFCGAVRYALDAAPARVSYCHCRMCRRISGAPLVAWATYPSSAVQWSGAPRATLASSPPVRRTFCAHCGTPLTFERLAATQTIDVTVGSMDDPAAVAPADHIWTADQLPWLELHDDLPRHRADP